MSHLDEPRIYDLHINPTYAVHIPQYIPRPTSKSIRRIENEKNLKDNRTKGILSRKSQRKLMNAVNWLVASAKQKYVYDKSTGKRYNFKLNFITLTLPTLDHDISDHKFKSVLLHAFINACRYKYGLSNYVWKVETQANGNIHAHFTTDVFIHWKDLRNTWNLILSKHGLINSYQQKHVDMSFMDYWLQYSKSYSTASQARKAYNYGVATNWTNPNTTDVRAVHKVKDISAYLAKYLSKNDEERRLIKGRLWSCSESLSHSNRLIVECTPNRIAADFSCLYDPTIEFKQIERVSGLSGNISIVGEIYFFSHDHWGSVLNGQLLSAYNRHRFKIRHSGTYQDAEPIRVDNIEQPKHYILHVPPAQQNATEQFPINYN
jgi:hypothetical protein